MLTLKSLADIVNFRVKQNNLLFIEAVNNMVI